MSEKLMKALIIIEETGAGTPEGAHRLANAANFLRDFIAESKWKDASKFLPPDTAYVIIELCWTSVFVGYYSTKKKAWFMGLDRKPIQGITAWQPFPKPQGRKSTAPKPE